MERTRKIINACLGCVVLAIAIVGTVILVSTKPAPQRHATGPRIAGVDVLPIEPVVCNEPIVGYGTVRPKRQVKVVPQVGGKLVLVHPDMAVGNVIEKGELLFEIEPRVYQSRVAQVDAEIQRLDAELRRHERERESLERRLELAVKQKELAQKNVDREQDLRAEGSTSAPELEAAKERLLRYEDAELGYRSELALVPIKIEETKAVLTTKQAQLDEAKLNLENTKIYCPFDARVDAVSAQESQVVIASFQIAELTDMGALEVSVVIDPRDLRWTDDDAFASAMGDDLENAPDARVTWTLHGQEVSWSGKITRLEKLDEVTRTAHVVVEIRDVMLSLDLGKGRNLPPLSVGMFCRAELPTERLNSALLVPRHAIHEGGVVYVYEADAANPGHGTLAIKHVPLLRSIGDQVLVAYADEAPDSDGESVCELAAGDQVITSPLTQVVDHMPLMLRDSSAAVAVADVPVPERDAWAAPVVRSSWISSTAATISGPLTGAR